MLGEMHRRSLQVVGQLILHQDSLMFGLKSCSRYLLE